MGWEESPSLLLFFVFMWFSWHSSIVSSRSFNFSFFILELFVLSSTFPSSYWTCCSLQKILQVEVISLVFTAPLFHFVPQPCFSDSVSQPQELCRSGRTRCIKLHTFGLTSEDLIGEVWLNQWSQWLHQPFEISSVELLHCKLFAFWAHA